MYCIVDLTLALEHGVRLLANGLHALSGGAPLARFLLRPRESLHWSPRRTMKNHLIYPVYINHSVHLLPYFLCPNDALVHILLWTQILLSENKGNIRAQLRSELHAKEATTECSDSVFQVACSFCARPLHLHSQWSTFLCQAAHTARPRSGIVLLIHIRLPGSNPSHLTAPTAKCL